MGDSEQEEFSMGISIEGVEKAMEDVSKLAWAYFDALFKEGFARREAMELTKDFLTMWWATSFGRMGKTGG
ncbi:hypothetical protein ES705_18376 [subsurface metagenome]